MSTYMKTLHRTHKHMHPFTSALSHTHMHMCTLVYTHTYTYMHMCTLMYTHTYTLYAAYSFIFLSGTRASIVILTDI